MDKKGCTIDQFMWGYQPHFRISFRIEAKSALESVGFFGDPVTFLVGFKVAGSHAHEICVEPEDGPYAPSDFIGVAARAEELYEEHPESKMWHTNAELHERKHAALRDWMRGDAVASVFQAHGAGAGRTFFASRSRRVGDYEVHIVLGVRSDLLASVPQLRTTRRDEYRVTPSLVHAIINRVLHQAFLTLFFPDPGSGFQVLRAGSAEIVRGATEEFLRSVLLCAGMYFAEGADRILSAISALPYEGRAGVGSLIIGKVNSPDINLLLKLRDPVDINQTRAVRKLMEASGCAAELLVAEIEMGGSVYGFGRLSPSYDPTSETVFGVSVLGRGAWDLTHEEDVLLSVRDGISHLPVHVLDVASFKKTAERLLTGPDLAVLENLATIAANNEHGAMLVVSSDAAGEADRLAPQSWAVEPTLLSDEVIQQLTAMDGAILVDPQGRCHAVGVILDGRAAGRGDPARGSRFNNAVRYLDTEPPPAVVIVYSTDGSIDILPKLQPRVKRQHVTDAVSTYLNVAVARPPQTETVSRAWDAVKKLRFYLSDEQCRELNSARKSLENWKEDRAQIRIIENDLVPDLRMNDEHWL